MEKYLVRELRKIGFEKSSFDECLFFHSNVIFIVYSDNGIFASPYKTAINKATTDLNYTNLNLQYDGTMEYYLSINIQSLLDWKIKISKALLINQIIADVMPTWPKSTMDIPAASTKTFQGNEYEAYFPSVFN